MLFSLIEELTSHRVGFRNLCKFINPPSPGWVWRTLYRIYVVWEAQESRAKTSAPGGRMWRSPHTWHDAVHPYVGLSHPGGPPACNPRSQDDRPPARGGRALAQEARLPWQACGEQSTSPAASMGSSGDVLGPPTPHTGTASVSHTAHTRAGRAPQNEPVEERDKQTTWPHSAASAVQQPKHIN